jgi:hypothetical protein
MRVFNSRGSQEEVVGKIAKLGGGQLACNTKRAVRTLEKRG